MSRRVITLFGGTGFIGRHVVQRLAKQGAQIRIATRDIEAANFLKPMGEIGQITPVPINFSDKASIHRALNGANQAVNLIGVIFETRKHTFKKIHVGIARDIAHSATKAGLNTLIHVSALGASLDSDSVYLRTKAAGEVAVKDAFKNAIFVRPSAIFGKEDRFFNILARQARFSPIMPIFGCQNIQNFKFFGLQTPVATNLQGDGGTRIQPVYVADVADAIVRILGKSSISNKIYEFGGPTVYEYKSILELVLRESGRRRLLVPFPFFAAKIIAWIFELFPNPPITRDQLTLLKSDNVISGELPGFSDLSMSPAAVEAILPTYLRQYRPPAKRNFREA